MLFLEFYSSENKFTNHSIENLEILKDVWYLLFPVQALLKTKFRLELIRGQPPDLHKVFYSVLKKY